MIKRKDFQFFLKNAGYYVGRGAEVAIALARAEQIGEERGWQVEFEYEDESYLDVFGLLECCERANRKCAWLGQNCLIHHQVCTAHYEESHNEIYRAVLRDEHGKVLASLGMIDSDDAKYQRVVAAELALENLIHRGE